MAIPWIAALRAAEALLSGAAARRAAAASDQRMQSATERLAALEKDSEATAQLIVQLTEQIEALARTTDTLASRLRWLLVATIVSVILGSIALIVALVR
jgi:hypothetical protein